MVLSATKTIPTSERHDAELADVRSFLSRLIASGQVDEALDQVVTLIAQLMADNEAKAARLARLLRDKFGSTSERISREQLELLLEEARSTGVADEDRGELPTPPDLPKPDPKPPRVRKGRNPLPPELPRERKNIEPAPELLICDHCGKEKGRIGQETSEILEYEPARLKVVELCRGKYACKSCGNGVVVAPVADKVIERGLPGPGLLAQVVLSKYQDHLPLYRQSQMMSRLGVDLAVATLAGWIGAAARALDPIFQRLMQLTLTAYMVGIDDTTIPVLDRDHPRATKKGHMWALVGYELAVPIRVAYFYTETWEQEGPCRVLAKRTGYIQSDGYKGVNALFDGPGATATRVGCWAHVRRKFKEALDAKDLRAAEAVELIGRLYEVERLAQAREVDPTGRMELRQEYAKPAADTLKKLLDKLQPKAVPKTPLGKAVTYAVNQWPHLQVYLADGAVPIDNNDVERRIKPVVLGRKNYLFAGSDAGAESAAVLYTVLASCRLAGHNPFAYLRDVFEKLGAGWPARRLDELLPENWRPPDVPGQPMVAHGSPPPEASDTEQHAPLSA